MSDLTDEELAHEWSIEESRHEDWPGRRMIIELQRHRASRAADEERVRSVVREAFVEVSERSGAQFVQRYIEDIATRATKQLASAAVRPSEEDVATLDLIRDEVGYGISVVEDADGSKRDRCCSLLDRLIATVRP